MVDFERMLEDIGEERVLPSEQLVRNTKNGLRRAMDERQEQGFFKRNPVYRNMLASVAVVFIFFMGFMSANLFGGSGLDTEVAFYTLDINPSVCFNVNREDEVLNVVMQNNDSFDLMSGLDCIGLKVDDAIMLALQEAKEKGYISSEDQYVVIGRFTGEDEDNHLSEEELQSYLEDNLGDMVQILVVSGDLDDKDEADKQNVSAGLLKVQEMSQEMEVEGVEEVARILEEEALTLIAPILSCTILDTGLRFTWNEVDFSETGYEGQVTYRLISSASKELLNSGGGVPVETFSFTTGETQPKAYDLMASTGTVSPGEGRYYQIKVSYGDYSAYGNKVQATMPVAQAPAVEKQPDYQVNGEFYGDSVKISWEKATREDFQGYKVVASKDNPNPSYPEDGYVKYITDRDVTSQKLYTSDGFAPEREYYFSVTYLYSDGGKEYGSSVKLFIPEKEEPVVVEPVVQATYISTTIRGSQSGSKVSLSWDKIDRSRLDGYKVMYSFTDTNPVYGDGSKYYKWITNPATTSVSLDMSSLYGYKPNTKCYFSITALYDGHDVKKPSNVISFKTADASVEPVGDYVSTKISGSQSENTIYLVWNEIDHSSLDGYKVMYSFTDSNPVYGDGSKYYKWITDSSNTGVSLDITQLSGYSPGAKCYFSITALYNDHAVKKPGNVISFTAPGTATEYVENYVSTTIRGSQSEETINLSWDKINHSALDGYKVMYSYTDSEPVYGDGSSYYQWITNPSTTSVSLNMTKLNGYSPGDQCYFSITALYDGHAVKKPGNVISFVAPDGPSDPPEDYVSTTISGSQTGETINLSWDQIDHSGLDGYKVMYSYTDSEPVYGDGSSYYRWITNPAETNVSLDMTSLGGYESGATCYFSITALYDGHAIKMPGNVISYEAP